MSIKPKTDELVEQQLTVWLELRQSHVIKRGQADKDIKTLDPLIKSYMRDHDVDRFELNGVGMKITGGVNQTIIKNKIVTTLSGIGWDPDQIKWFLGEVTQETSYDYADVRSIKEKEGE